MPSPLRETQLTRRGFLPKAEGSNSAEKSVGRMQKSRATRLCFLAA
jgi:hypothetical protein